MREKLSGKESSQDLELGSFESVEFRSQHDPKPSSTSSLVCTARGKVTEQGMEGAGMRCGISRFHLGDQNQKLLPKKFCAGFSSIYCRGRKFNEQVSSGR